MNRPDRALALLALVDERGSLALAELSDPDATQLMSALVEVGLVDATAVYCTTEPDRSVVEAARDQLKKAIHRQFHPPDEAAFAERVARMRRRISSLENMLGVARKERDALKARVARLNTHHAFVDVPADKGGAPVQGRKRNTKKGAPLRVVSKKDKGHPARVVDGDIKDLFFCRRLNAQLTKQVCARRWSLREDRFKGKLTGCEECSVGQQHQEEVGVG